VPLPPADPPAPPRRAALVRLAALALLLLLAAPGGAGRAWAQADADGKDSARPSPLDFGAELTVGCLRFRLADYRDRQGDVQHADWVRLTVQNRCRKAVRGLQVRVFLVDGQGLRYGEQFSLLGRGESLRPGKTWEDELAIPDPENRVARGWHLRVLRARGLDPPPSAAARN